MRYEIREAIALLRKEMLRDPEIVTALLRDETKETAYRILKAASRELSASHTLASIMSEASMKILEQNKKGSL